MIVLDRQFQYRGKFYRVIRERVQTKPWYSDAKLRPLGLFILDRSLLLPRLKSSGGSRLYER